MKVGRREEKGRNREGKGVVPHPKQKSGCATGLPAIMFFYL